MPVVAVTYPRAGRAQDLRSGNYSFQARAVDAAGNVGAPTAAYAFAVDASLPLPAAGPPAEPWLSGWHLYGAFRHPGRSPPVFTASIVSSWKSRNPLVCSHTYRTRRID